MAFVLALILGYIEAPAVKLAGNRDMDLANAFDALAGRGIYLPTGKPEYLILEQDLRKVIDTASDISGGRINPYPVPVSPTQ